MFRKNLKYVYFIIFIFFAAGVFAYFSSQQKSCQKLSCLVMKNLDQFQTKEVYQDDPKTYRALLWFDEDLLRVEVNSAIANDEAEKQIQAQITRMKALFEKAAAPYPGEVSDVIQCPEEFRPIFGTTNQNNLQISHFTGFLNSRLVFGACTADQVIYQAVLALFYCPEQKQLFQLEIIAPAEKFKASPEKYNQRLKSLACKD
jgi:hypothetical protein